MVPGANDKPGRAPVAALLFLSLLWAPEALRTDLLPNLLPRPLPSFEREALALALFAALSEAVALWRKSACPRAGQIWSSVLLGLGLFVVPQGLLHWAEGSVSAFTRTALLTLTPVFAVVLQPHFGGGAVQARGQGRGALLAALAAAGGAFCVFPAQFPTSPGTSIAFSAAILAAACVAAANCLGVAAARSFARPAVAFAAPMAAIAAMVAAAACAALSLWLERPTLAWTALAPELAWAATIELPGLLLLFWLMPRLSAARMATRYGFAPLFAVLMGAAVMQARLAARTWLGLLILAAGSGWLLFAPPAEDDADALSLRF